MEMEELYNSNHIIKGKRGDIYRGHTLSAFSDNKKITINNTFWDTTVSETYDADLKQTKTSFYFRRDAPKWQTKLIEEIKPFDFNTAFNDDEENTLEIKVNDYFSTYEVSFINPGLCFKDAKEHISNIRYYKKIFSAFHKKLKKTGTKLKDYKIVGKEYAIHNRFFNEFDIALATEIKGLPF